MRKCKHQSRKFHHLSFEDRIRIETLHGEGISLSEIGRRIGKDKSTISRELLRNQPVFNLVAYRATRSHARATVRWKKAHYRLRIATQRLRAYVIRKLKDKWSPELIAGKVGIDLPGFRITAETIYCFIYRARPDLIMYLKYAHKRRRKRGSARNKRVVRIPGRIPISKRPKLANERRQLGHWEVDTMVSRSGRAALLFVRERVTRFTFIVKLQRKTAEDVHAALVSVLAPLPPSLRRTLTYDNGSENVMHKQTGKMLRAKTYFCTPYHSWEKGAVEQVIGLVRWLIVKGANLDLVHGNRIIAINRWVNRRPMKCLGFQSPQKCFERAVAIAA